MSHCILCVMLARKKHELHEMLHVILQKDSSGTNFLGLHLPACAEHQGAVPVIVQRVPGTKPEVRTYDATVNLFERRSSFARLCASCGHPGAEHDVGEDGGCGMELCPCLSFESIAERVAEHAANFVIKGKLPLKETGTVDTSDDRPGASCPDCHEDCMGWVVEGKRCGR